MDRQTFKELARKTTDDALALMDSKQTEYTGGRDNAFYNFIRSGEIQRTTPELALFGKMNKHYVSLIDMIEVPAIYSEAQIDSKVHDIINYVLLLKGLLLDRNAR